MKHILITILAVLLVGCGKSQQSVPESEIPTPKPVVSIHSAAGLGEDEIVKQHLADGIDINLKDEFGYTPLHKAVNSRYFEIAELLIAEGADVNAKNNWGSTPLHMAVSKHWGDAIELLIDNGGHINAKDNTGRTPLDNAQDIIIDQWKEKVITVIRKHGGKHGTISRAAIGGDIEAVKELLAAGADVNAGNSFGSTPLHAAALNGHKEIVELLTANGASVNAKKSNGRTPLDIAADEGYKEIAELLIAAGADVNLKDKSGHTPLHSAAGRGHKEIAELLIAKGADVNAKRDGETPLDWADDEIADLLRKHGAKTGEELKAEGK